MMGLRTLEISKPADVHVLKGQLRVTNEEGEFTIPLEDLMTITCIGPNIRMSTLAQSQIADAGVSLMVIDEKYRPACILMPIEANARQTLVMRRQISLTEEKKNDIWVRLIRKKIKNQSNTLKLLGREGYEKVYKYSDDINKENVDAREASAAREYFYLLDKGLNRRIDDPLNSCLNYGYAVLRNAIIRSSIIAGFISSIGFHHNNYLNAFNLADDLIEPWRPFVDIIAVKDPGDNIVLNKSKRKELAMVLHHACMIDKQKTAIRTGIDEMVLSIRNLIQSDEETELKLPEIIPLEIINAVDE